MTNAVFITVVLLRFAIPLFIPRFPLPAVFAALVLDAADQTIFQLFTDSPLKGYQSYDKALDIYYLAIAYVATMRNWRDPVAFEVARFLYLYRLVGVTLFELTHYRWLLLVFPNTFEYFFIAYEAVRTRWNPRRLTATAIVGMAAFIWVFIKLPQEWWIHIAKLDFTEFMAARPQLWYVLFGLVAAALGTLYWQRARIPQADWSFTVDVDRHREAPDGPAAGPTRFWSAVLVEKSVFLALVSVIFAQILPSLGVGNLGLAVGVVLLVVLNAAISRALQRRGRSWASTVGQFTAMLVINLALVLADVVLGPQRLSEVPVTDTLFLVVLLSLLIALFDRYRDTRPSVGRPHVWALVRAERAQRLTGVQP